MTCTLRVPHSSRHSSLEWCITTILPVPQAPGTGDSIWRGSGHRANAADSHFCFRLHGRYVLNDYWSGVPLIGSFPWWCVMAVYVRGICTLYCGKPKDKKWKWWQQVEVIMLPICLAFDVLPLIEIKFAACFLRLNSDVECISDHISKSTCFEMVVIQSYLISCSHFKLASPWAEENVRNRGRKWHQDNHGSPCQCVQ